MGLSRTASLIKDNKCIEISFVFQYEHLIGNESALDAARVTETNKSYGMVSAESKKDKRTVEVIQAEIRAKKKMKLAEEDVNQQGDDEDN